MKYHRLPGLYMYIKSSGKYRQLPQYNISLTTTLCTVGHLTAVYSFSRIINSKRK